MDWFRMYGDMPDDPKIGTLSDAEFRTWVELLCAACKAGDEGNTKLTKETVNWALRRDVTATVTTLSQRELVTMNGDGEYVIKAWQKRQYKTDSSTERTRKYRENKKNKLNTGAALAARNVTDIGMERHSDALEQNRTDTDKNKEKTSSGKPDIPAGFASFWLEWPATPRKVAKAKCLERWRKAGFEPIAGDIVAHVRREKTENPQWRDGYEPAPMTYLNQRRWEDGEGLPAGQPDGWWTKAGFESRFEAENAGCNQFICDQFHDGKRIGVTA